MRNKTVVNHWRYEDGWRDVPHVFRKKDPSLPEREFSEEIVGWHCWVYAADDLEFHTWMEENMKYEYDCTFRFNSGDPMHTVFIKDDEDATMFKLKWL